MFLFRFKKDMDNKDKDKKDKDKKRKETKIRRKKNQISYSNSRSIIKPIIEVELQKEAILIIIRRETKNKMIY
jgi:hypothetical protein